MSARTRTPDRERARQLRSWLEYVVETAIDMLDHMDAQGEDLEDDELEIVSEDDAPAGAGRAA